MVSKASEDLPEPERPVTTIRAVAGQIDIDALQIVLAGTANADGLGHGARTERVGEPTRTIGASPGEGERRCVASAAALCTAGLRRAGRSAKKPQGRVQAQGEVGRWRGASTRSF